ncbi:MAG: hypothetical protein HFG32_05255 [Eubacterium sp.]|nr:hypothetical protein [Eubacterium sp.]
MKLLYGTGNPAKLFSMRKRLQGMGIEVLGLRDLGCAIPQVAEDGQTPLENARQKALAYYQAFQIPVFSCDSGLAKKYGNLTAFYKNAICLVMDEEHIYEAMEPSMESERFWITEKSHVIHKKGFPLDSLSVEIRSGRYYYDLPEEALDQVAVEDGFLEFFRNFMDK